MKRGKEQQLCSSTVAESGSDIASPLRKKHMANKYTMADSADDDVHSTSNNVPINRFGFGYRAVNVPNKVKNTNTSASHLLVSTEMSNQTDAENPNIENVSVVASLQRDDVMDQPESISSTDRNIALEKSSDAIKKQSLTSQKLNIPRLSVRKSTSVLPHATFQAKNKTLKHSANLSVSKRRSSAAATVGIKSSSAVRPTSSRSETVVQETVVNDLPDQSAAKENTDAIGASVVYNSIETILETYFGSERMEEYENLLLLKLRAKKFEARGRMEELQSHNKKMKGAIRNFCDAITLLRSDCSQYTKKVQRDHENYESRLRRMNALMAEKDMHVSRVNDEMLGLQHENEIVDQRIRDLSSQNKHLMEQMQQDARVRTELETSNQRLLSQLQQAQKLNDELSLELRSHKATMSDRVHLYEVTKKEMEELYNRHNQEEEKSKRAEIERLQSRLTEAREEIATINQEKASYRQRVNEIEDELRRVRDVSTSLERDKYALETKLQSSDSRVATHIAELTELKEKLKQKEDDLTRLVDKLAEIQKLMVASNSKVEMEKKDVSDRIEQLQLALRDAERNNTSQVSLLRELRAQVESDKENKTLWAQKEKEMQDQVKQLQQEVQDYHRKSSVELGMRQIIESQMRELRTEHIAVNAQMEAVKYDMKRMQESHDEAKALSEVQVAAIMERNQRESELMKTKIEHLQEEKVSLQTEVKTLKDRVANVRGEDMEEVCQVKREAEVLRLRLKELSSHGSHSIAQKDKLIAELEEKIRNGEKLRRAMHNTIQELRGNVRVFARTRPFLPSDGVAITEALVPAVSCEYDGQKMKLRRQAKGITTGGNEQDTYVFSFDKVFSPSMGQDAVFEEVAEFVQSSIDGYHVCLFSYGQTGSGKTHTVREWKMQGSGNGQMRGIIPRAIEKVLKECEVLKTQGWTYNLQVSFLEIYNESLKDLLASREDLNKILTIKKDMKGGVYVPELTLISVKEISQVENLMERACRSRSVASTDMNEVSSRSHSVFTLHIEGMNESEGIILDGKLNLVDLAGSERASRSNVSGERLKETQAINKSLSCLSDVFTAIGNKSPHIPFRNSKLTYLLQSSLSGDGKTLMMVNVSPTQESASETLCSLRFAQQVNKCELGKPKRQIKCKKEA